jgi:nucleotide-binding universal stress UspA family protein
MTLLHVAGPDPDFVGYEVGPETVRDAVAHKLRDQHRQLDAFRDHAEHEGVSTRAIMIQGPTLEKVLSQIERLGASYVVVGSHGHGGLHDLIAGSAIQGLLKRSPIPVVVVPPKP